MAERQEIFGKNVTGKVGQVTFYTAVRQDHCGQPTR